MAVSPDSTPVSAFPTVSQREIGGSSVQTVNARDLHAALGVGKVFRAWIVERIATYGFREGCDFASFADVSRPDSDSAKSRAQTTREYALTVDMAKELAMVERNEAGKLVRAYFIECERKLREGAVAQPAMPNLRDPRQMVQVASQLLEINQELAAYKEMAEPKVDFYDKISATKQLFGLRRFGKMLGVKPQLFIRSLIGEYLYREAGVLTAHQQHVDAGLFYIRTKTDELGRVFTRTFATGRGFQHFAAIVSPGPVIDQEGRLLDPGHKVKKVGAEMIRLTRRPQGASIQELCALSGQKEQTARSRISKLREKGFDIVRDLTDGRYYLRPRAGSH